MAGKASDRGDCGESAQGIWDRALARLKQVLEQGTDIHPRAQAEGGEIPCVSEFCSGRRTETHQLPQPV